MARISAMKEVFYYKLHRLERKVDGSESRLTHIGWDDKDLHELRAMLKENPDNKKPVFSNDKSRRIIKENGLLIKQVDEAMGKYAGWMKNCMTRGRIKPEDAKRLADFLGVTVADLME